MLSLALVVTAADALAGRADGVVRGAAVARSDATASAPTVASSPASTSAAAGALGEQSGPSSASTPLAPAKRASARLAPTLPSSATRARRPATPPPPALPPVGVTLQVLAPSVRGQWLLRLDNKGDAPALVSADVRLLRFEVRRWDAKKGQYASKGEVCDGPQVFGLSERAPFGRELVLEPGHSYVEAFDPRLLCFGKQAALLEPGMSVAATYGFAPQAQVPWRKVQAPEEPPFVADTARGPRDLSPIKRLAAEAFVLSDAPPAVFPALAERPARSAADADARPSSAEAASRTAPLVKPSPYQTPKDGLAAAMSLTTDRFADASSWRDVAFEVEAHNVGARPLWAALRARQLSFMVHSVSGEIYCPRVSQDHHIPRDMFEELQGGRHRHIGVTLSEPCGGSAFLRPGLYVVVPTLHADDNGAEYGISALTGTVTTRDPGAVGGTHLVDDDATLVRVRSGPQSFYTEAPRAIPTDEAQASSVPEPTSNPVTR